MAELSHNQLSDALAKTKDRQRLGICLIHGQSVLVEQCAEMVIETLLDGASRDMSVQALEGTVENIPDLLEEINTFAMLAGPKIVVFKEARIFEGRSGHQKLVDQIVAAVEAEETDQAARYYLSLCGRLDIDPLAPRQGRAHAAVKTLIEALGSKGVDMLASHCADRGWSADGAKGYTTDLQQAIENGFPPNHHLIVTVGSKVPKNLKLYKRFEQHGLVVDCNVPTGDRRADRSAQENVLRQTLAQLLEGTGKELPGPLFQKICQMTGFDLPTFKQNIEKLIDYSGSRSRISQADVDAVMQRTKVDPVYELTNAVADRNAGLALQHARTLVKAGWHPLQILAALVNQMRKLIVAKDFARSRWGRSWTAGCAYPQFQAEVMPAIQEYDRHVLDEVASWTDQTDEAPPKKAANKKKSPDIALAPNPKNAYPVYQTLIKANRFTLDELIAALDALGRADARLKSTAQDPQLILAKTILDICDGEVA